MKRNITLFLVVLFFNISVLYAQSEYDDYYRSITENLELIDQFLQESQIFNYEDTSELEDLTEEEMDNLDTTFAGSYYDENLPGFGVYKSWDTARVHYPRTDFSKMMDSVLIRLTAEGTYVHPFKGIVTSKFGWRKRRYHYGYDIDLETGDPVKCAFEGVVRYAKYCSGYGYVVVVRHDNNLETLYAHLSYITTIPGKRIHAGDVIGLGGNTGRSRGSHLHFETRYLGTAFNPADIINFSTFQLKSDTLLLTKNNFRYLSNYSQTASTGSYTKTYYKVRNGDTLGGIASRYRTSISQIKRLNGLRSDFIRAGQTIRIR